MKRRVMRAFVALCRISAIVALVNAAVSAYTHGFFADTTMLMVLGSLVLNLVANDIERGGT